MEKNEPTFVYRSNMTADKDYIEWLSDLNDTNENSSENHKEIRQRPIDELGILERKTSHCYWEIKPTDTEA